MSTFNCHVYCDQRGERFCGSELSSVKDVAAATGLAADAAITGDYVAAERHLREAVRALADAAAAREAARRAAR